MILAFMPLRALPIAIAFVLPLAAAAEAPPGTVEDDLTLEGMTFVSSAGSRNDAIVEAARAQVARVDREARLSDVHARIGKAAGGLAGMEGGLELRCQRATFDLDSGDLTAEGGVDGVTADGRRFETERVTYDRATGRVSTRVPVVIRDAFGTIRGAGFEYWVRENRFRLIGGASVEQGR
jgi:LPS export ABC transporter protein LptC